MNPLQVVEKGLSEVEHGIEFPFKFIGKAAAVISTAIKDQPEIKNAVTVLVEKCDAIGADTMIDVAERGLNLIDDAATVRAVADLGEYLKSTFIPLVEKLYGEIKTDVTSVTESAN